MTRYANIPRNEQILALFKQHIPPKQIVRFLQESYPEITVKIVYNVVGTLHVEPIGEIRGISSVDGEDQSV